MVFSLNRGAMSKQRFQLLEDTERAQEFDQDGGNKHPVVQVEEPEQAKELERNRLCPRLQKLASNVREAVKHYKERRVRKPLGAKAVHPRDPVLRQIHLEAIKKISCASLSTKDEDPDEEDLAELAAAIKKGQKQGSRPARNFMDAGLSKLFFGGGSSFMTLVHLWETDNDRWIGVGASGSSSSWR